MHGAPDRQPGRPQAEGRARSTRCWSASMRCERITLAGGDRGAARAADPGARARAGVGAEPCAEIIAGVRGGWRRGAVASTRGSSTPAASEPRAVAGRQRSSWRAPADAARPARPGRASSSRSTTSRGRRGDAGRERDRSRRVRDAHASRVREVPVRRAAVYVPGGRAPYPSTVVMGVVPAQVAGVAGDRGVLAAGRRRATSTPVVLGRVPPGRRLGRVPDGRRAGDRRARLRHRDDRRGRRDRRPRQPVRAGGQAPAVGAGRDRRLRRPERPDGGRRRRLRTRSRWRSTCWRRPSTAPATLVVGVSAPRELLDALAGDARPARPTPARSPRSCEVADAGDAALDARARRSPPSTCSWSGADAEALATAVATRRLRVRRRGIRHRVRRLHRRLEPHPPDGRGGAVRVRRSRPRSFRARSPRCGSTRTPARSPARRRRWPARRASSSTRARWRPAFATIQPNDAVQPRSTARPARPTSASASRSTATGAGERDDRRRVPRPHARPARAPRPPRPRRPRDRRPQTGAHHTVEDVGICIGQALDEALGDRAGIARYGIRDRADGRVARVRARSTSPAAGCWSFEASLPPGRDRQLRPRAGRGVLPRARDQREADAAHHRRGGHQRAPHDRGRVQGRRRGRCGPPSALDPTEHGVPSTKGTLV